MNRLIHLSDPHFGTEDPAVVAALALKIEAMKPEAIILTGDITQRARRNQFRMAETFLQRFAVPVFAIPGNHDIPLFNLYQRFLDPYRNYTLFFSTREPHLQTGIANLLGLDATTPFRHKCGQLDAGHVREKVEELRKRSSSGSFLCLCIHQPVLVYTRKDEKNLLLKASKFVELFSALKVDLVLSGHIHLPLTSTTARWYPDLSWHFVFSGAGTCVSIRTRSRVPNSFNAIFFETGPEIVIEQHDYDSSKEMFLLFGKDRFKRGDQGWALQ